MIKVMGQIYRSGGVALVEAIVWQLTHKTVTQWPQSHFKTKENTSHNIWNHFDWECTSYEILDT